MHTLFSRKPLLPLLGLSLAGLLLTPHSAHAFGYFPPAPDLTVTNGTAKDDGTSTAVTGQYSFANGTSTSTTNFTSGVEADNSSSILFTGGGAQNVTTKDNSTATLTGGTFDEIGAYGNSTVTLSGGTFSNLYTFDNATINLIGTNLTATYNSGSIIGFGFVFPDYYRLGGMLSDGTAVNGYYDSGLSSGGRLQFNGVTVASGGSVPVSAAPVPEASSVISLGLMLALGAGGLVLARRKKAGAAA